MFMRVHHFNIFLLFNLAKRDFAMYALGVVCSISSSALHATGDVTSREYKHMLNTLMFTYSNEYAAANNFGDIIESSVEYALGRNVKGHFSLEKQREVKFFDTPSSCFLKNNQYAFRERVENGQSEVTLKYRNTDRFISAYEDVSSSTYGAKTKLEEDISKSTNQAFKSVYGHSTKAPNSRNINRINDIFHHFPAFAQRYAINSHTSLLPISMLIYERVYTGMDIDLGSIDAGISLTLWYDQIPSAQVSPVVAELSFKYKDPDAEYSRKVVNRAKVAFETIGNLNPWISQVALTKTAWIYASNPNFCQ